MKSIEQSNKENRLKAARLNLKHKQVMIETGDGTPLQLHKAEIESICLEWYIEDLTEEIEQWEQD